MKYDLIPTAALLSRLGLGRRPGSARILRARIGVKEARWKRALEFGHFGAPLDLMVETARCAVSPE